MPSPPSASLTMQTKRDQARSETELGSVSNTPHEPSAAMRRQLLSSISSTSSVVIAAPRIATLVSRSTNLLCKEATVCALQGFDQDSISESSTLEAKASALSTSACSSQPKCSRTSFCSSSKRSSTGLRSVGLVCIRHFSSGRIR